MNGVIKIFNTSTFECELELQCHSDNIWFIIQLDDGRLCTTSVDCTLKLWNLSSSECETTLVGHEHWVTAVVQYSPTQICSGFSDKTVRIWNISTGICEKTIPVCGRCSALELLPNGLIACLSYDGHLLFWNAETDYSFRFNLKNNKEEELHVIEDNDVDENGEGILSSVHMTQLASGDLCISSNENGAIYILDFKTHQKIKTILIAFRAPKVTSMTVLRDGRLALCMDFQRSEEHNDDRKNIILIYDFETGEFEQEIDEFTFHVLQLSDGRLCTAFLNSVAIWK
jgi:WD40 repeat protein